MLDGCAHALTANEGPHHLHGGALGFGKRKWRVLEGLHDASRVVLALTSPAGEEGYPGTLDVTVSLAVTPSALRITFSARTDAATPVNLTYHPYFNLAGDPHTPATTQSLRIPASHYLPVRAGLIPTGEFAASRARPSISARPVRSRPRISTRMRSSGSPAATIIAGC